MKKLNDLIHLKSSEWHVPNAKNLWMRSIDPSVDSHSDENSEEHTQHEVVENFGKPGPYRFEEHYESGEMDVPDYGNLRLPSVAQQSFMFKKLPVRPESMDPGPALYYSPHLSQAAEQLRNDSMKGIGRIAGVPFNAYGEFPNPEHIYADNPELHEISPPVLPNPLPNNHYMHDRDYIPHMKLPPPEVITKMNDNVDFMRMPYEERLEILRNSLQRLPEPHMNNNYDGPNSHPFLKKAMPEQGHQFPVVPHLPEPIFRHHRDMGGMSDNGNFMPNFEMQDQTSDDNSMDSSDESDSTKIAGNGKQKLSRKQFRETIGSELYVDLVSGKFSYEEIIDKYKRTYPEYAHKFTRNFCSKVRCGRILVNTTGAKQRCVKNGDPRMKRITKISNRKTWTKMTPKLFSQIYAWEQNQKQPVKQIEIENSFNVNRSTYYRWKRRYESSNGADSLGEMKEN